MNEVEIKNGIMKLAMGISIKNTSPGLNGRKLTGSFERGLYIRKHTITFNTKMTVIIIQMNANNPAKIAPATSGAT